MTVTALTGPGRVVQFLWGPNQQNTLTFGYPLALDNPRFWRTPRVGSEQVVINDRAESWTVARDYYAAFLIRWVPLQSWSGGAGVQAFLDWATGANPFTFIPDAVNAPYFSLPGCILTQPFATITPQLEVDGSQAIDIEFRNPTYDLGLAWRGLMFEYNPGASLTTDPLAATVTRASVATFFNSKGQVETVAAGVLRDRHYPGGFANGLPVGTKETLLEGGAQNSCLQSQTFDNATWTKSATTVTADAVAAPDGTTTADYVLETATTANHYIYETGITITSGEGVAGSIFVKAGPRFRGRLYVGDIAGTNWFATEFNLTTGTTSGAILAGASTSSMVPQIIALGNGWFWIGIAGKVNAGVTSGHIQVNLYDDTGTASYLGDITKGLYLWGAQLERNGAGGTRPPSSYIATTTVPVSRVTDNFIYASWPYAPMAQWIYEKFEERGTLLTGLNAFGGYFTLGDGGDRSLFFVMEIGNPNYSLYHRGRVDRSVTINASTVKYGDIVELLGLMFADGSVQLRMSINGAADVVGAQSGAFPDGLAQTWNTGALRLGMYGNIMNLGLMGLQRFKTGPGSLVNTIALARAA